MTPRQAQCLAYLRERDAQGQVPPSYIEIAAHLGIASTSRAHALIESLIEQGHIIVTRNRARGIELAATIKVPPEISRALDSAGRRFRLSRDEIATRAIQHGLISLGCRA